MGFSSCSSQALEHRLSSCGAWAKLLHGMWDLPGPGIEPVSPALVGGLFTIEAPGEPSLLFNSHFGLGILPLIFLSFFFLAFQMKWLSHRIMKWITWNMSLFSLWPQYKMTFKSMSWRSGKHQPLMREWSRVKKRGSKPSHWAHLCNRCFLPTICWMLSGCWSSASLKKGATRQH